MPEAVLDGEEVKAIKRTLVKDLFLLMCADGDVPGAFVPDGAVAAVLVPGWAKDEGEVGAWDGEGEEPPAGG